MKKDICNRLAHKETYIRIEKEPEKEIDLLIVVDQLLTGFDSKWINTLYLDKILEYENIIQAFSRTNRLFGAEKPFGIIKYYRKPHTMEEHIKVAVKVYSGDKPIKLFEEKLPDNLKRMNDIFHQIKDIFEKAGIKNFEKLPDEKTQIKEFADNFKVLNKYLIASKIQGFKWETKEYEFENKNGEKFSIELDFDENTYLILAKRYKERSKSTNMPALVSAI